MNQPYVDRQICGYCGACISVCPTDAIELVDLYLRHIPERCINCQACVKVCPLGAMKPNPGLSEDNIESSISETSSKNYIEVPDFDVLVIGAGPAGSIAARTAARENLRVLLIEKRQEIGVPVRCAEGVSRKALSEIVELDQKWISAEINSCRIHSPDGNFVKIEYPNAGLILERKIFDRELAAQAASAGAEVWVKSMAIDLLRDNGKISGAIIRRSDGDYSVKAKVVIGADGVESRVGKMAGINTTCKNNQVDTCVQYLLTGLRDDKNAQASSIYDPDCCDFYLGHEVAPRGYAWIFPKGKDSANVGVGIGGHIQDARAFDYLNRFVKREFPRASVLAMVVGCVPVSGTFSEIVKDGFMLVGDAARQNDPLSGGGIVNSMIAGQIAGQVASKAIHSGNVSKAALSEYEKLWHKTIGRTFLPLRKLREGVLKFSDRTFNDLAKILSRRNSGKATMVDIFWTALKNEPKLLLELRHLISIGWFQ